MKVISNNRRAYHDYEFEKDYEVGIVLKGFEVKAIKSSQVNIKDAIVRITDGELWIQNMDIPLYKKTSPALVPWYEAKGKRKLLINKKELAKLSAKLDNTGNVALPLSIFINKK
ncbi:SsrA-binding protein [Patescibacteria group bacterium]|nr:SsrA-binding protein [Patescibacteria group bacterium]MBU1758695.1 SsrA-binding protein [Patescibacteria group bacterium]